ncbi:GGDEF domain-containing protein [Actinoplanes sp. NBRC 103695]|uniref:GGDEF domain-containing protein n=1 Tax=Actinoplanes sp. NBRC 103695 TaxID=3032202 RepID=UPI002555547A|nr:GGDEF domain-containing protein [Actinoplanes sp. NBRC 103695]
MPSPLSRTRMIAYLASSAVLAAHVVPVLASDARVGWTALALTAIAAMLGVVAWATFRGRLLPGEPVLTPVLLVVAGGGLSGPVRIMTIGIAVFAVLALHGSVRAWAVRSVLGLAVLPGGTALAAITGANDLSWRSAAVLSLVPFVVPVGLVMRNINRVLTQQETVSARDALLSSAGGRILAAQQVDEVHRIGIDLGNRMIALAPGVVMIIVKARGGQLTVARSIGLDEQLHGRLLPDRVLDDPATVFADMVPGHRYWHMEYVVDRHLLLGGTRPITDAEVDAYRNLVHQVVLGERNLISRAELLHRAHHDSLTQLANREYFFDTLTDAVTSAAAGSVAVMTVDLDDFKQVNDTHGHGAGDDLLVEVAHRLRAGAGPNGVAARLGGDEFAVLLTGLTDAHEAERIAWDLRDRLIAPIRVGGAVGHVLHVGASIGISGARRDAAELIHLDGPDADLVRVGGAGPDAAELIREADLAMYAAKAAGKNRVERFTPVPAPR